MTHPQSDIKLYFSPGSPYCRKVQLVLEEKNISYQKQAISFTEGENKTEHFLNLNPRGKVPTLVDGDITVYESNAIVLYLEDKFKEIPLMPESHSIRSTALIRMMETQYINDALLLFRPYFVGSKCCDKNKEEYNIALQNLLGEFNRWETYLSNSQYIAGNVFTLADACFIPYLGLTEKLGLCIKKISTLPNLTRYYELVCERESVKKTMPTMVSKKFAFKVNASEIDSLAENIHKNSLCGDS